jgi:hypothetical protein
MRNFILGLLVGALLVLIAGLGPINAGGDGTYLMTVIDGDSGAPIIAVIDTRTSEIRTSNNETFKFFDKEDRIIENYRDRSHPDR